MSGWVQMWPVNTRLRFSSRRFLVLWNALLMHFREKPTNEALDDTRALAELCDGVVTLTPGSHVYRQFSLYRRKSPIIVVQTPTQRVQFACEARAVEGWLGAMDNICFATESDLVA